MDVLTQAYAHVNIGIRRNAAKTLDKMFGFTESDSKESSEDIEQALSEMFRELLDSIRTEIEARRSKSIRTFESEAVSTVTQAKTSFEVSFEPAMVAVG